MEPIVYVLGHRNPDTDSVVSAAAYARLKQLQGFTNYRPARAGKINPQTEYIFTRFGVPIPEYLPDLIPKVGYYLSEPAVTVTADISLWEALERMEQDGLKVLPIVNADGTYRSLLHYNAFARYILKKINPHKKAAIPTSIQLLLTTLRAQPLTLFDEKDVRPSPVVVAALAGDTFQRHLEAEVPENALVIVGDREDIQRFCIERRVRALIITNGNTIDKELIALAEARRVSVMISPFDTSSTSLLIIYSTPVGFMGDESVAPVHEREPVRRVRQALSQSISRCVPVVNDASQVVGILSEGDLIKEPQVQVIMVDHNEPSQAIEGIENYRILEVIDHHRLGNLSTRYPITFINRVVGATSTLITNRYREERIPLDRSTASILLCGILADTLVLQSATTTPVDLEAAEYLASITGLDIQSLGQDLMAASSTINARPADELIRMDMKEYDEGSLHFTVSQVETDAPEELVRRKGEILQELEGLRKAEKALFSGLMVTDVTELNSLFFVTGDRAFVSLLPFPKVEEGVYLLQDMVSRKKQLLPLLSEVVEKLQTL